MRRTRVTHLLDVYSVWLHVVTSPAAWARHADRIDSLPAEVPNSLGYTSSDIDAGGQGLAGQLHVSFYLDLPAHKGLLSALVETVAHEAAHGAGMILDHYEETYTGTSEAHAYLVGWLAQWLWSAALPPTVGP